MKILFIPLFCLLTVCTCEKVSAQGKTDVISQKVEGPQFQFRDGDTYNFGELPSGPDASHDFIFTNTGTAPLIITDAKPSCSCTTPEWPRTPVLPGQTSIIKVGYHTKTSGAFNKEVYIRSNAVLPNGEKRYIIYIKGSVQ